jgi:hypothetical protein
MPDAPYYTAYTNNNKHPTVKAMHAINKKMLADIVTMNTALANVSLEALSLQVCASFLQRRLCKPDIVFVDMFMWFINHYRKTMAEDCKANRQRKAANWHPVYSFDPLVLRLFTCAAFTGCANFTMADCDIVNIGLCVIKRCGMHAKKYKAWIAGKAIRLRILKTFDSFKAFWAANITLVNQTAVPASQYGTEWPPPTTTTLLSHMEKPSQTLVLHTPPSKNQSSRRARQLRQCKINLTPCQSTAWRYSNNQPQPATWLSISLPLPTVGVDLLDATEMAAAAAAAARATNSRHIHSQGLWANVRITPTCRTSASKTGTTATLMVAMLTMGTPAGRAPNQAPCTIHTRQGPT